MAETQRHMQSAGKESRVAQPHRRFLQQPVERRLRARLVPQLGRQHVPMANA